MCNSDHALYWENFSLHFSLLKKKTLINMHFYANQTYCTKFISQSPILREQCYFELSFTFTVYKMHS